MAPRNIPFVDLAAQRKRISRGLRDAVARVMAHGQYILGPEVAALEEALAHRCGARQCIACANGTDALMLVLMAEGIGPGDAVFVPAFTFVATAEAVAEQRATPVFVDVREDTYNLDARSLERAVAGARGQGLAPRMMIAVDLFGQPADYPEIRRVADEHGLIVVADAAQSFGAAIGDEKVGTLAAYTTTSFFPAKPLGCYGDGGAVFTDSAEKSELLHSLRLHGRGTHKYENVRVGLNSRLDTLQAAILLEKLTIFEEEIAARERAAARYDAALAGVVSTPRVLPGHSSVWALYTVVLPDGVDRAAVQAYCASKGVPTAVYYGRPLHAQAGYAAYPRDPDGLPVSETLAGRVLSLPMHPYLGEAAQRHVTKTFLSALKAQ